MSFDCGSAQPRLRRHFNAILVAGIFVASTAALCQTSHPSGSGSNTASAPTPTRYAPNRLPRRETEYYTAMWGVDSFAVKSVESGELIRFTYRVVDGERAKGINDKKNEAYLVSAEKHVKLVVPSLEKVGQLRQSSEPIVGNTYWMAFSNPGRPIKPGDRVDIEIGQFHVQGVLVQ
ncbi:hypothetical protein DYQ86_24400 [Acidobacteria bacterium AB60]|nr:hypothetical protein DYQ86_24400 [Acidobacteria bacterium AB60]